MSDIDVSYRSLFIGCKPLASRCTVNGGISSPLSAVPVAIEAVPASHGIDCNDTPFVGGAGPSVRGPS